MKHGYLLKNLTTTKVGGPAKYFINVRSKKKLMETIGWAGKNMIKWQIVGEGSNLIPSDRGFDGLIIKNEIEGFKRAGDRITAGAGTNLLKFIFRLNDLGLAGMEKMAGIPGTVGGAIYGSAGAYGQEIKDNIIRVKIFDTSTQLTIMRPGSIRFAHSRLLQRQPPGSSAVLSLTKFGNQAKTASESARQTLPGRIYWLSKKQCQFGYRESIFKKKKNWVILEAEFKLKKGNPKELSKISEETVKLREQKYWPNLLCPGSFFKNIIIKSLGPALRRKFLSKIPKEKIMFGKVPAGWLLEKTGAKGMRRGSIKVAGHHGNLIYNLGRGKTSEIVELAEILKSRVRKKFGIKLDEEIQYI